MPDALFSWPATVIVGVVIAALLLVSCRLIPGLARTTTLAFYCPRVRRRVTVQFLTDEREPVCVLSCGAFEDSRAVTCGAPCLTGGVGRGVQTAADQRAADLLS